MYATIRTYRDPELADQLASRSDEVETVIGGTPGLRGYYLIRTDQGCTTITIADDEAGVEESSRRAADWLRDHASEISSSKPQVTTGEVLVTVGAGARA